MLPRFLSKIAALNDEFATFRVGGCCCHCTSSVGWVQRSVLYLIARVALDGGAPLGTSDIQEKAFEGAASLNETHTTSHPYLPKQHKPPH